jgi:hypothetical protein
MINTDSWADFRVGDLFNIHPTKAYKMTNSQILDGGKTPVIANSAYNNGIGGYSSLEATEKGNMITFSDTVDANTIFYQPEDYVGYPHVQGLYPIKFEDKWNQYTYQFFASVFRKSALTKGFDYGNKFRRDIAVDLIIKLPVTSDGTPDWNYMESYMKAVMEESEQCLENLKRADDTKHLIDVSGWGEFKLSDLFTKKTMKGYPKKAEVYDENENGYHIYGQNIGWQYPYKVLMDEQYLHKVEPNKPILAYASSVGEIGLINESFYRSGDNGAFQGLFPIGYHPNFLQMQFVLSILKKEFEKFRYDTSMQNTMDITFKLPIDANGEPNWQYMEDYMKQIMDKSKQIISDLQIVDE